MRGTVKLLATTFVVLTLIGTGSVPKSQAAADPSKIQALEQQRAALVAQLDALLPNQSGAATQLGSAENTYMTAQNQTLSVQQQLDDANAKMAKLSAQIAQDEKTSQAAKSELAQITRAMYESSNSDTVITAVLSSGSFGDALQQLQGARATNVQLSDLQKVLLNQDKHLADEKAQLQKEIDASTALEGQLSQTSDQFFMTVEARNADYQTASGPVRDLQAQINNIDNEIAALQSPGGAINDSSCGNHFSFGQCTWYVATRRCVPWIGNANQWFSAAASYGYAEGHSPEVGAIVVFWPGGDGASWVGHVGYVEAVGPAGGIPAGYFKLSEMNYAGWDVVSYRVLPDGSGGIQGFIYGKN